MKKLNLNINNGYTLLELTIVMTLLLVVGTLIVGIFSASLRGTAKTKITNELAQNGNYALTVMSNMILNAKKFQSITLPSGVETACDVTPVTGSKVTIVGFDGGATTFSCDATTISSASAIFSINAPAPAPFATNSLLDTSQVKLVPGSCFFRCVQPDLYSYPRVDIYFQLQNAGGTATVNEKQGTANFSTTVSVRNQGLK